MAKQWTYKHGMDTILVENTLFRGESLFVNGELQDKTHCLFSTSLYGKLPTAEEIKVSLGGLFAIQCCLFVDNNYCIPRVATTVGDSVKNALAGQTSINPSVVGKVTQKRQRIDNLQHRDIIPRLS